MVIQKSIKLHRQPGFILCFCCPPPYSDMQQHANGQRGPRERRSVWLHLVWGCVNQMQRGGAPPHGAASPGAWRSTSNLFAVIAVRVYTLQSSNSLFYFSHHEGDHLSACPHLPHPLASGPSQSAQNTITQGFDTSHLHPASVT